MISPERQAELIDKYRYYAVEESYWEDDIKHQFNDMLYEQCGMRAIYITYDIDRGWANFTARAIILSEFLQRTSLDTQYPEWMLRDGYVGVDSTSSLRNEYHVVISANDECYGLYENIDEDVFKRAVEQVLLDKSDETYDAMTNDIEKFLREMCSELWYMLNEEYSYLTSDEAVWEHIVINKYHLEDKEQQGE